MNELVTANPCPGLFYETPAQDGILMRIRVPGGILNTEQASAIVSIVDRWNTSTIQVTNRANLQFRAVSSTPEILEILQNVGLAAQNPEVDHLRNVMASPTAGIDPTELVDTRSIVQAIDTYIQTTPELAGLPPKFSVGIDGGGQVSIGTRSAQAWQHRYNEIQLSAISSNQFQLAFTADKQVYETGVLIDASACVSTIATLAQVYLSYVQQSQSLKKPRMRDLLNDWGVEGVLDRAGLQTQSITPLKKHTAEYLGIHPQKQSGRSYIGIALVLGQMTIAQFQALIELTKTYGSGELRLTPWQAVILPNIAEPSILLEKLSSLGFSVNPIQSAIVACAGKPGCASAETHTQAHALALTQSLKHPINIHITGCSKGCAQPSPADITLLGTRVEQSEAYYLFAGDQAITDYPVQDLSTIAQLINARHD
jgi:ferredoxin-nitrite reductase